METATTVFWHRQLAFEQREGRPLAVTLQEGERAVVLVRRKQPDAEGTHDTGLVEELYLEFKGSPAAGETLDARQALAKAFYQFGSVVLAYQSSTFEGTLRIREWVWGGRVSGSCQLEFSFPILNRVQRETIRVAAEFGEEAADG